MRSVIPTVRSRKVRLPSVAMVLFEPTMASVTTATSDDDLCTSTCRDQEAFISVWRTDAISETITLPLRSGFNYNATVDWGDGTTSVITSFDDPDRVHTYASAGDHTVKSLVPLRPFISTIVVTKTSSSPFRIWAR